MLCELALLDIRVEPELPIETATSFGIGGLRENDGNAPELTVSASVVLAVAVPAEALRAIVSFP
jgi:hypothetical protein